MPLNMNIESTPLVNRRPAKSRGWGKTALAVMLVVVVAVVCVGYSQYGRAGVAVAERVSAGVAGEKQLVRVEKDIVTTPDYCRKLQCSFHANKDCYGHDIRAFHATSAAQCLKACSCNSQCTSVQFYHGTCWLKRYSCTVGQMRNIAGGHTYNCVPAPCQKLSCRFYPNKDCFGHDIRSFGASSASQCRNACSCNSQCTSVQFYHGTCWLKKYSCSVGQMRNIAGGHTYNCAPASCKRLSCKFFANKDCYGHDIKAIHVTSSAACRNACSCTKGCTSVQFYRGTCWLKAYSCTFLQMRNIAGGHTYNCVSHGDNENGEANRERGEIGEQKRERVHEPQEGAEDRRERGEENIERGEEGRERGEEGREDGPRGERSEAAEAIRERGEEGREHGEENTEKRDATREHAQYRREFAEAQGEAAKAIREEQAEYREEFATGKAERSSADHARDAQKESAELVAQVRDRALDSRDRAQNSADNVVDARDGRRDGIDRGRDARDRAVDAADKGRDGPDAARDGADRTRDAGDGARDGHDQFQDTKDAQRDRGDPAQDRWDAVRDRLDGGLDYERQLARRGWQKVFACYGTGGAYRQRWYVPPSRLVAQARTRRFAFQFVDPTTPNKWVKSSAANTAWSNNLAWGNALSITPNGVQSLGWANANLIASNNVYKQHFAFTCRNSGNTRFSAVMFWACGNGRNGFHVIPRARICRWSWPAGNKQSAALFVKVVAPPPNVRPASGWKQVFGCFGTGGNYQQRWLVSFGALVQQARRQRLQFQWTNPTNSYQWVKSNPRSVLWQRNLAANRAFSITASGRQSLGWANANLLASNNVYKQHFAFVCRNSGNTRFSAVMFWACGNGRNGFHVIPRARICRWSWPRGNFQSASLYVKVLPGRPNLGGSSSSE